MKRVSIFNNYANNHQNKRNRVIQLLKEFGFTPMANGDIVLVIGGDGTFLSAVKERYKEDPAFVCLNSGNLGFFSEFNFSEARKLVQLLAQSNYKVVEYPIYEVHILQPNGMIHKETFINDVVIERKSPKIIHMEAILNNKHAFQFSADSIIVSTSLGAGAYAMSAGGSIFMDHSNNLQISTIGQQRSRLYSGLLNPLVVPDDWNVQFASDFKKRRPFRIVCDGKEIMCRGIKSIRILNTNKTFKMIRSKDFDYGKHIIEKLF